jgi:uncharacterized damage-inducible protein DinB
MERAQGLQGSREIETIADEIRRSHHGDPWHGPGVTQVLEGLTAAEASARPIRGAHTIWELVLHLTVWREEVARRLESGRFGEPPEGDWPEVPRAGDSTEAHEAAWVATRERLAAAEAALQGALAVLAPERLAEVVGGERDAPLGTGTTYAVMLHGVAQHDAYHAGQVKLLRKALDAIAPPQGTA